MTKNILSLIHDDFEDLELWYPILRLQEEGCRITIAGEKQGAKYTGKYGVPAEADISFDDVEPERYDGLLVPGGWAPDKLRRIPRVLEIVRAMNDRGILIGQICHGGSVLISAGILRGLKATSSPGIRDDMINAGTEWIDKPVVVDRNIVSSRRPPDLPEYVREYIRVLMK